MNYSPKMRSQQGVALLTILLLVVAITIVAGSMLARQRVMVREYAATQRQGQAQQAALAGEAIAREIILQDSLANQADSLQEAWAKPLPQYPITGGSLSLRISDEASRFNINNLYHDGNVDNQALAYFRALLQAQGIEPEIAMAVLDWQDPRQRYHARRWC
jgi:type II secretory pathway component PulK